MSTVRIGHNSLICKRFVVFHVGKQGKIVPRDENSWEQGEKESEGKQVLPSMLLAGMGLACF